MVHCLLSVSEPGAKTKLEYVRTFKCLPGICSGTAKAGVCIKERFLFVCFLPYTSNEAIDTTPEPVFCFTIT